jgi:hypothetical protein
VIHCLGAVAITVAIAIVDAYWAYISKVLGGRLNAQLGTISRCLYATTNRNLLELELELEPGALTQASQRVQEGSN